MEAEQQEREEDLFMEGNIIKVVKKPKYLGAEAESKGTMDAEIKKRIGRCLQSITTLIKLLLVINI
jgi:hypothetical protein